MTKNVSYDTTSGLITGMFDAAVRPLPTLPDGQAMLAVTDAQWGVIGPGWGVVSGVPALLPASNAPPTLAQQALAALAAGVQITSTSTPALDGTYAISSSAQAKIQAVSLFIVVNGKFPGGQSTMAWADAAGAAHTFPNTAAFQAFATAVADYVAALDAVLLGISLELPAQPLVIA